MKETIKMVNKYVELNKEALNGIDKLLVMRIQDKMNRCNKSMLLGKNTKFFSSTIHSETNLINSFLFLD